MKTKLNPASMLTPLMDRVLCTGCQHMHRPRLRWRCECCAADFDAVKHQLWQGVA